MDFSNKQIAIFTMGLPGAGKSTVLSNRYDLNQYTLIDPDKIKEEQPDYDPKKPDVYHAWSKKENITTIHFNNIIKTK